MNNDFNKLMSLINSDEFLDINHWSRFKLVDLPRYKNELSKNGGIYLIMDSRGIVLYVGKASSIHNRLNSHYKATRGLENEKYEAWKQFFEHYQDNSLLAYYKVIDGFSDEASEKVRKTLERIIQIKYQPLFDRIYTSGYKKVNDLQLEISKLLDTP